MTVIPDHEIEERCRIWDIRRYVDGIEPLIEPFDGAQLQPASYDVLLADKVLIPTERSGSMIINNPTADAASRAVDLREPLPEQLYREQDITDGFLLFPGQFVLSSTLERVSIPVDMVGRIEGKSSIGRLGMTAHITAGYLDPGFRGNVTLEIANFFTRPIRLWPGVRIAQLGFEMMSSACERPYGSEGLGSHYQDAKGVEGTRYGEVQPSAQLSLEDAQ